MEYCKCNHDVKARIDCNGDGVCGCCNYPIDESGKTKPKLTKNQMKAKRKRNVNSG